uniref:OTU domain-containing protein n=1 Tax=Panagrellus redivivus TaxID=6233 RepID=A0A7E4VQZ5_PANRE
MKPIIDWTNEDVLRELDGYLDYEHLPKSRKPPIVPRTAEELRLKISAITNKVVNRGSISKQIVKRRIERAQQQNPTNSVNVLKQLQKRRRIVEDESDAVLTAKRSHHELPSGVIDLTEQPSRVNDLTKQPSGINDLDTLSSGVNDLTKQPSGINDLTKQPSGINDLDTLSSGVNDLTKQPSGINDLDTLSSSVNDLTEQYSGINDLSANELDHDEVSEVHHESVENVGSCITKTDSSFSEQQIGVDISGDIETGVHPDFLSPSEQRDLSTKTVDSSEHSEQERLETEKPKLVKSGGKSGKHKIQKQKRNPKTEVQYYRSLNSRLKANLIVVPENEGFVRLYTIRDTKKGSAYARCVSCHSTGILKEATGKFCIDEHTESCNPTSLTEFNGQKCTREARNKALHGERIGDAHWKGFAEANDEDAALFYPEYFEQKTQLSRWSKKCYAQEDFSNLQNGQAWKRSSSTNTEVYMTDTAAKALASCEVAVADATFEICPQGFSQVFTIHGLIKSADGLEEYNNLMFALMKGKSEAAYREVADTINGIFDSLNLECQINRLHTDFEMAEQNAMAEIVGEDHVYGCLFHFTKAVLQKIGELKLYPYYRLKVNGKYAPEYMPIRIYVRCLLALPCLPKADAQRLWRILKTPPPPPNGDIVWPTKQLKRLVRYYRRTWINRKGNTWTFWKLGRVRNTNAAESFHSAQSKTSCTKPSLNAFLSQRRTLATAVDLRLVKLQKPKVRVKPQNLRYKRIQKAVEALELEYEQARQECLGDRELAILMIRFTRRISYTLHDIANKSGKTVKDSRKKKDLAAAFETSSVWKNIAGIDNNSSVFMDETLQQEEMNDYSLIDDGDSDICGHMMDEEVNDDAVAQPAPMPKSEDATDEAKTEQSHIFEASEDSVMSTSATSSSHTFELQDSDDSDGSDDSDDSDDSADFSIPATSSSHPLELQLSNDSGEFAIPATSSSHSLQLLDASSYEPSKVPADKSIKETDDKIVCISPPTIRLIELAAKYKWTFEDNPNAWMIEDNPNRWTIEDLQRLKPVKNRDVKPDGNCGFRALSFVLTGSEDNHKKLRKDITSAILNDKLESAYYRCFGRKKIQAIAAIKQYPARSASDIPRWMTTEELVAAAILFNLNIIVYTGNSWQPNNQNFCLSGQLFQLVDAPTVLLDNSSKTHFQVVLAVQD